MKKGRQGTQINQLTTGDGIDSTQCHAPSKTPKDLTDLTQRQLYCLTKLMLGSHTIKPADPESQNSIDSRGYSRRRGELKISLSVNRRRWLEKKCCEFNAAMHKSYTPKERSNKGSVPIVEFTYHNYYLVRALKTHFYPNGDNIPRAGALDLVDAEALGSWWSDKGISYCLYDSEGYVQHLEVGFAFGCTDPDDLLPLIDYFSQRWSITMKTAIHPTKDNEFVYDLVTATLDDTRLFGTLISDHIDPRIKERFADINRLELDQTREPEQRKARIEAGYKTYFPGTACPHGHFSEQYTNKNGCTECHRIDYYLPMEMRQLLGIDRRSLAEARRDFDSLNALQQELLVCIAIGDGHITPWQFSEGVRISKVSQLIVGHSMAQADYAVSKLRLLQQQFGGTSRPRYGYATDSNGKSHPKVSWTFSHPTLCNLRDYLYPRPSETKVLSRGVLEYLSALGLAIWFMDDGTSDHRVSETDGRIRWLNARLITQVDNPDEIIQYFQEVWDISFKSTCLQRTGLYDLYSASTDDAERFYSLIAPYVIPSMDYKLDAFRKKRTGYRAQKILRCEACRATVYVLKARGLCAACYRKAL